MKYLYVFICSLLLSLSSLVYAQTETEAASDDNFCALDKFESNKVISEKLSIEKDPTGLAVEAKNSQVDVSALLQQYAAEHECTLYGISMDELVKGLMKGSLDGLSKDNDSKEADVGQKVILVDGDKAICIKKLGLQLPIKKYGK